MQEGTFGAIDHVADGLDGAGGHDTVATTEDVEPCQRLTCILQSFCRQESGEVGGHGVIACHAD
eukprot:CAMPEP_0115232586 /NCGR_PEP_ID=MMETSP0270-20121206/33844_1 /TAXON_ID=71861 /ORGANISM="Scrippsiella trochoidea, Strain CCMP3099" /LENGTH=63 /DNA_ID=CAMNT_0002647287 /DNA_START=719 /DNA_END=910 /DNA_ORIENTATION=+